MEQCYIVNKITKSFTNSTSVCMHVCTYKRDMEQHYTTPVKLILLVAGTRLKSLSTKNLKSACAWSDHTYVTRRLETLIKIMFKLTAVFKTITSLYIYY